jgi:hypothetical protein
LPPPKSTAEQLLTHVKMYEIADKYGVRGLKDLSKKKFSRACMHFWKDSNFAEAAEHVFSTTPDNDKGLRDIVSETIANHIVLWKTPAIETLMTNLNGLALGVLGVLRTKAEENGWC